MSFNWKNYLADREEVEIDFGISNVYSSSVLAISAVISIVVSFTNIFVGIGVLILGIIYWTYLTRGKKYAFTNRRIILIDIFMGKNVINIDYDKITNITVDQNVIDLMGGWGTIIIDTAGSDLSEAVIQNVNDPQKLKNKLNTLAEDSKKK